MKLLAFNVDFHGPSLEFLGSRKPAHEGIKEQYPHKSRYFTVVASLSCCLSQQAIATSFLVVSTWMTLKDPDLSK